MRNICKTYQGSDGFTITSPDEQPHNIDENNQQRSRLRFVNYQGATFHVKKANGAILPNPVTIPRATSIERTPDHPDRKVAATETMFLSLIHEGLCFLNDIHAKKIRLANMDAPIPMTPGLEAIVTILYEEEVLVDSRRHMHGYVDFVQHSCPDFGETMH